MYPPDQMREGKNMKNSRLAIVSAIVLGTCQFTAAAAEKKYGPGVTDTEIKIGQTVPYSGPASAFSSYGRVMAGYFQMLNEKGGINSRKVNLISLDNAYSPPKALEQTRKLVEDDEVLADVGTVGTVPNIAIQKYLNQNKIPHVFASAGGRRFNDPQNFPWTVPFYPAFQMEGAIFGKFILRNMPNAKIAVLYQNDDYGKDFLSGLKDALGNDANARIIAEANYELTYPTIDSHSVEDFRRRYPAPLLDAQIRRPSAQESPRAELEADAVSGQPDKLCADGAHTGRT
jgi:branched-chain amino acid transport system substrate-binding protein